MPTEGTGVETEKRMIVPFKGDNHFQGQFVGFEIRDLKGRIPAYIAAFSGNVYKDMDIFHKAKNVMMGKYGSPILDYIGLDSMEYDYVGEYWFYNRSNGIHYKDH